MEQQGLNQQNDFFSAKRFNNVVMLTFKGKVLPPVTHWSTKKPLFDYLDLVSKNDSIRIIVVTYEPGRSPLEEYLEFYDLVSKSIIDRTALHRMCSAYDQFIIRIVESNKFFISVDHSEVTLQDFSVSLACDYRIMADNTVIDKPHLELGVVPKGGGPISSIRKWGTAGLMRYCCPTGSLLLMRHCNSVL